MSSVSIDVGLSLLSSKQMRTPSRSAEARFCSCNWPVNVAAG